MTSPKSLAAKLRADESIVTAWASLAAPILGELLGRSGFPAVTFDMQHGQQDFGEVREGMSFLSLTDAHKIVRIPVGEMATASRALDIGAECVIAPMINSVEDAQAFAEAMKYPPVGKRSWGPHRAAMLKGQSLPDYLTTANDETVALAMIETPEAIAALDDILDVPGIDGIFVGPSDMSLTLSNGAKLDPNGEKTVEVCAELAERTRAKGKIAGVFCMSPERVHESRKQGYRLMAYGFDVSLFMGAATAAIDACR